MSNQKTKLAYNPTTLQPFACKALRDGSCRGCNPCKAIKNAGLQPSTTMTKNDVKKTTQQPCNVLLMRKIIPDCWL